MIDVSLLGALVWFGNVITIEPGIGAVAFCTVVILWDATERPRQMSAVPACQSIRNLQLGDGRSRESDPCVSPSLHLLRGVPVRLEPRTLACTEWVQHVCLAAVS